MKLYKYISPDVLDLVFPEFGAKNVCFKCAYPRDYNDPYELFLTIDPDQVDDDIVAYYLEILGEIPQFPTSCFSKLPNVTPMWAHYARDLKGFVIEVDEDILKQLMPGIFVDDVDYQDEANIVDLGMVRYAYTTGKPRHTFLLQRATFSKAYFTKNICWSYEAERRAILKDSDVTLVNDNLILSLSPKCVTAIIAGPRAEEVLRKQCVEICEKIQCEYYEMRIGKSSIVPYFMNTNNETCLFDGAQIGEIEYYCEDCGEPINNNDMSKCNWCTIDEDQLIEAASRNPMRILDKYGLLEDYVKFGQKSRDK